MSNESKRSLMVERLLISSRGFQSPFYGVILALLVAVFGVTLVSAQAGGQFCVRAYEDRNANASRDTGEPLLTRGISANLMNAESVIVASALLDNSPTAAQGVICFQFLEPGDYTVQVTSADYNATTPVTLSATITAGQLPTVVEYGGQSAVVPTQTAAGGAAPSGDLLASLNDPERQRDLIQRLALAGIGSLIVMAVLAIIGFVIYLIARGRQPAPAAAYADPRYTTGSMRTVTQTGTGEMRPVMPSDTGEIRRTGTGEARRVDAPRQWPEEKQDFDFDDL
ncbi:MAG: hypothetical protein H7175_22975 [Burkholderiales bacterium]|nr:hypothetical protein [Anaerolineae bacterium]